MKSSCFRPAILGLLCLMACRGAVGGASPDSVIPAHLPKHLVKDMLEKFRRYQYRQIAHTQSSGAVGIGTVYRSEIDAPKTAVKDGKKHPAKVSMVVGSHFAAIDIKGAFYTGVLEYYQPARAEQDRDEKLTPVTNASFRMSLTGTPGLTPCPAGRLIECENVPVILNNTSYHLYYKREARDCDPPNGVSSVTLAKPPVEVPEAALVLRGGKDYVIVSKYTAALDGAGTLIKAQETTDAQLTAIQAAISQVEMKAAIQRESLVLNLPKL